MSAVGTGEQIVFGTDDVRPQGALAFAAARCLRGFILAGIVAVDILVRGGHHCLQRIQQRRFSG
ncbi:MAG: hypothetical protein WAV82_13210, partial [Methylobacter sp.]